ncbi:PASTA domain-containing protein [Pseudobacteriovorax antillogorgiicola]|nr:PASTA domain-containing protein [Pseudobacteriovorax antillogorgiicola]
MSFLLLGCKDIVVKVGKKEKQANLDQEAASQGSSSLDATMQPRDLEFYLYNLDNLRNTPGDKLIERLEQNWRLIFRREFRSLRDSLLAVAEREHSYQEGIYFNVGSECTELTQLDIAPTKGLDYLPKILEGSLLAFISSNDAKRLNPDLESAIDLSAHLILFELGMRGQGTSEVEEKDGITYSKSRIVWKVDSEVQDPAEDRVNDHLSVSLDFIRGLKSGKPINFSLVISIAEGLYEGQVVGPLHRIELQSEWDYPELDGMHVSNSVRIFRDDKIRYSRQFFMEQTTKVSQVFLFRDTIRYGLPGETSRQAFVDFTKLEKCAAENSQILVPGVVGMSADQAGSFLETLGFETTISQDLTGGDPSARVRAQKPSAGSSKPFGSEVQIILDWPQDTLFDDLKSADPGSDSGPPADEVLPPEEPPPSEDPPSEEPPPSEGPPGENPPASLN